VLRVHGPARAVLQKVGHLCGFSCGLSGEVWAFVFAVVIHIRTPDYAPAVVADRLVVEEQCVAVHHVALVSCVVNGF
jgi:hypothetical protein